MLLVSLVQLAYAAWLATVPDWSSLWATMFVWAAVATLYAVAASVSFMTPAEHDLPLGLTAVRRLAPSWCIVMTGISTPPPHISAGIRPRHGSGACRHALRGVPVTRHHTGSPRRAFPTQLLSRLPSRSNDLFPAVAN